VRFPRIAPPILGQARKMVPEEDSKSQDKYLIMKDNVRFGFKDDPKYGPKNNLQ
jgi:hypothetical protein